MNFAQLMFQRALDVNIYLRLLEDDLSLVIPHYLDKH
jgi:hypothetical protein